MATATTTNHDDFYRRLRDKVSGWAERNRIKPEHRDVLLAVPDLFHLLTRLALDARVASRDKAWLGVAIAYVVSPLDLIPDVLGPIGYLDDLLVMVIVLDSVLKRVPNAVVREHWAGEADVLDVIRDSLRRADDLVGKGLVRRVRKWLQEQGIIARNEGAAEPPPVPVAIAVRRGDDEPDAKARGASGTRAKKSSARKAGGRKTTSRKKSSTRTKKSTAKRKTKGQAKRSPKKSSATSSRGGGAGGKTIGPREGDS